MRLIASLSSRKMKVRIQDELAKIEQTFDVHVLYACESGSRAWGFESVDSDWDVRFVYMHRPAWYLSIDRLRDVIECPIDEGLDISGWDLRKALGLFRKSNPPILEWLHSPMVYAADAVFLDDWRKLVPQYFSPRSCGYHYLSMVKHNYREYMHKDRVRLKKYFYILRPLLGCLWLERALGPVPMEFEVLVDTLIDDIALKADIKRLVDEKRAGIELSEGPCIESIGRFLKSETQRLFEEASQ